MAEGFSGGCPNISECFYKRRTTFYCAELRSMRCLCRTSCQVFIFQLCWPSDAITSFFLPLCCIKRFAKLVFFCRCFVPQKSGFLKSSSSQCCNEDNDEWHIVIVGCKFAISVFIEISIFQYKSYCKTFAWIVCFFTQRNRNLLLQSSTVK